MSASLLFIQKLKHSDKFPGYFVASTAPYNVEDDPLDFDVSGQITPPEKHIQDMADYLKEHQGNAEILIVVHGYNTRADSVREWFENIQAHISEHCPSRSKGFLLIGYRWPSEQIVSSDLPKSNLAKFFLLVNQLKKYKDALPIFPGILFLIGSIALLATMVFWSFSFLATIFQASGIVASLSLVALSAIVGLALFAPIFTIIILRLVVYFRDNYRANHFGIPDLVELIRQIDHALTNKDSSNQEEAWKGKRIKLSFIGHSMGGFVVTNTVRILSNVFDSKSVGTIDAADSQKNPSPEIGNVFCLSRLVLVSPDIPAETIISGRANFLHSSLRRFEEAYLFSNEGDMALRLASTAANYFSYPSRSRVSGYRLGNVTVRSAQSEQQKDGKERVEDYGIVARLPNGLLVKLQDRTRGEGDRLSRICGGQLATVNQDGELYSLNGEPLKYSDGDELVNLDELLNDAFSLYTHGAKTIACLIEGQIVVLPNQMIASLQKTDKNYWHFSEFKEGHLCRVQGDRLFSFNEGQMIKFDRGTVARIRGGKLDDINTSELKSLKDLDSSKEQILKTQSSQFAVLTNGKFVKYENPGEVAAGQPLPIAEKVAITWRFPLDYLFISKAVPLSERQKSVALAPGETPIGELFTCFDCTDYVEPGANTSSPGVLSQAKRKMALGFFDYVPLTISYFLGKIDTHGGYFNDPQTKPSQTEATFTKLAIYGIACLGFENFLAELTGSTLVTQDSDYQASYARILQELAEPCSTLSTAQRCNIASTLVLAKICQQKQIQVLLSKKCFAENVLGI